MNYLEIAGTAVGVIYLWLEYRASTWLWLASIVMPALYIGVYYQAGLYADLGISIYYVIASIYGAACWLLRKDGDKSKLKISHAPGKVCVPLVFVFLILLVAIDYILTGYTDSTVPLADAFTTSLSIVAMWMLARKYVEQWLVWIAADVACAVLYVYKDLWFTGGLYLAYAIVAAFGYRRWKGLINE
ncbi:MAG: nicotinamide mononucleotide transporter [Bacteroides sp.]|nr:nicotinamide mononucleotide transporter [Bacteroides sp.]